jgi:hypothetical protein
MFILYLQESYLKIISSMLFKATTASKMNLVPCPVYETLKLQEYQGRLSSCTEEGVILLAGKNILLTGENAQIT